MVLLKIVGVTPKGDFAVRQVAKMKSMRLATLRIVSESPVTLHIVYAQNVGRIIMADAHLKMFAVTRGLQMAQEAMALHGATEDDYTAEVVV